MKRKRSKRSTPGANTSPRPALTLTGVLVASTVMSAAPLTARAQGVEARSRSQQSSQARVRFDIPSGPLAPAIEIFRAVTKLEVRIDATFSDLQTKGLSADLTPQDALQQLLDGTGLTYVFINERSVVIRERNATVLSGMTVTADAKVRVLNPKYTQDPVDITRSIAVVSKDVIQQQNATSLRDIVRNVPGITINAGEGGGGMPGDNFNVRGFSATNDIFVDGIRDLSGYARESFNLEQVEVIKGPNSSVTGRGSTGGSINMVSKIPSLRSERSGAISLGSAEQRRTTVDVNEPVKISGAPGIGVRMNAVYSEAGVAGNDVVRNENWGVAPSLSIGLGSPTQATVSYLRSEQDNIPSYGIESFAGVPTVNTRHFFGLRSLDFEHVSSSVTSLRLDHSFGSKAQLRNTTTRNASGVSRIVSPANPTTGARAPKSHLVENENVTNQTTLNTSFKTGAVGHAINAGVEYTRENSMRGSFTIVNRTFPVIRDLNNPTADADFASAITPTVTRRVRATSIGGYAFENMSIGDKVELTGGLRWDSYEPEYLDSASLAQQTTTGFSPRKTTSVNGNVSAAFKPTANGSIYASYGTSFNPATENLSNDAINANSQLPPERSRNYEVGAKWNLFKQRLLSAVALFRTEKTNARTSDPANPGLGTILAGKQRVEGGEISLTGRVSERVSLLAGYSHLASEYVESLNPAQEGTSFTNVPKHSVNVWGTVNLTKNLQVGGGGRYVDTRLLRLATATAAEVSVPSYHTYDAVASYRFNSTLGLQLNLYNLSDKLYYDSGRMWVPAAARSFSVTTSVKF
jgi:catecholate siderophore receptor